MDDERRGGHLTCRPSAWYINEDQEPREKREVNGRYENIDNVDVFLPNTRRKMKNIVKSIISKKNAFLSEDEKDRIGEDIESFSDEEMDIFARQLTKSVESAWKLVWSRRLNDYIKSNPPKYNASKWADNPSPFLEAMWGKFMDRGILYQDQVSKYDNTLIPCLYSYWHTHGRSDADRLPLPKESRTDSILDHILSDGVYTLEEVKRAVYAHAKRQERGQGR